MAEIPGSLKRARCVIPRSANEKEGKPYQHEGAKHERNNAAEGFHEAINKIMITTELQLEKMRSLPAVEMTPRWCDTPRVDRQ